MATLPSKLRGFDDITKLLKESWYADSTEFIKDLTTLHKILCETLQRAEDLNQEALYLPGLFEGGGGGGRNILTYNEDSHGTIDYCRRKLQEDYEEARDQQGSRGHMSMGEIAATAAANGIQQVQTAFNMAVMPVALQAIYDNINPLPSNVSLDPIYRLDKMELDIRNGFKSYEYMPLSDETMKWLKENYPMEVDANFIGPPSYKGTAKLKTNFEAETPMFGEDWSNYFKQKYGADIVTWDSEIVYDVSRLKDTQNFRNGSLNHILEGELNGRGKAVGFHYEGMPTQKGTIISGTESLPNANGVYTANIEVNSVVKNAQSSFFPKDWTPQQIVDSINEAYSNKVYMVGNKYSGITSSGIEIEMFLDVNGEIISAYPIY